MSKNSREATESAESAILRMARVNCKFTRTFKQADYMLVKRAVEKEISLSAALMNR